MKTEASKQAASLICLSQHLPQLRSVAFTGITHTVLAFSEDPLGHELES